MTSLDPIIAVKDIATSSKWYQEIFGFKDLHGGDHFAVLQDENDKITLCLHPWVKDNHPTMIDQTVKVGNGLILYFRTNRMDKVYQNVIESGWAIEEDIHLNPNSRKKEFSFRDPDGYFLTVTEFHQYEG